MRVIILEKGSIKKLDLKWLYITMFFHYKVNDKTGTCIKWSKGVKYIWNTILIIIYIYALQH